ncbi:MAG: PQQ-dependent sugar dehydrogenase [Candidatus Nitrosotalea sp.]|nr:PQQ-dependent sugar dehydrogenase [Candidatus Nitrosotalea sp.]
MKFWLISIFIFSGVAILPSYAEPVMNDTGFVIQPYVTGICCSPTTMAFEGNDILVLSKVSGQVHLFRNGILQDKPVLQENVTSTGEQGMLGITTVGNKVYLYFTASDKMGGHALGKRVYSYDWNGQELVNKTLVKDLPQTQTYHNGGAMVTSKNGSVYLVVGDAGRFGKLQNHATGEPDDTSVIFRLVPPGPYYAIGIRNSFGLAIDPVTGNLWDTENGPDWGDEVNLVPPGFNSGWDVVAGPANKTQIAMIPSYPGYTYHDPQFSWQKTVAPTGIAFTSPQGFGKYKDSVFVGDCNNGNVYRFQLNQNRDGFVFNSPELADKEVNIGDSMKEIVFATGFGCISDVVTGPDGMLYITSLTDGTIYRIVPQNSIEAIFSGSISLYISIAAIVIAIIVTYAIRRKKHINKVNV